MSRTEPTTAEFLAGKIYKFFFLTNHESGSVGKTPPTSYLTHFCAYGFTGNSVAEARSAHTSRRTKN